MCDSDNVHDPLAQAFRPFVNKIVDILVNYLEEERDDDSDQKVCEFINPQDLEPLLKPLWPAAQGASTDELLSSVKLILEKTVKTGHRGCLNQLFHRADGIAIIADWITSVVNTSVYTYETAPVVTIIEKELIEMYRKLLGWETCEGFFAPGGSTSNMYGVALGRAMAFPHVQKEGFRAGDKPAVFISKNGHYSTMKSCGLLGIGYDACYEVGTDEGNRMCPEKLRKAMAQAVADGRTPCCIVATCGSTLTGAADHVDEILAVAEPHNCWVHADGCMGGGLIHSPTHRNVLNGVEKAHSFCLNPHKMLGATQQCSVFLTRITGAMRNNFSTNAAYLFNADKQYDADNWDVGDAVFQCGRKADALKLWMLWKQRGDQGMADYIDRAVATNQQFNDILRARSSEFRLMLDVPSVVPATCFWWIPEEHASIKDVCDPTLHAAINPVVPKAKLRLMEEGTVLLTMSVMDDLPNFWRFIGNGGTQWSDKQFNQLLDDVAAQCREVYEKLTPEEKAPKDDANREQAQKQRRCCP